MRMGVGGGSRKVKLMGVRDRTPERAGGQDPTTSASTTVLPWAVPAGAPVMGQVPGISQKAKAQRPGAEATQMARVAGWAGLGAAELDLRGTP